jgi:hypothetical protein
VPSFRIGASNLPAKDIAYLRALVRLFAYTEKLPCSFVDSAPYTAQVAVTPGAPTGAPCSLVLTMLEKVHVSHTIAYPIRADQLRDWIKRMTDLLAQPAAPQPARANCPTDPHRRYKLRRWPSPMQLKGDPIRIRMATFMSRQYVSAAEIGAAAFATPEEVRDFLDTLELAGLFSTPTPDAADLPAPPGKPQRGIAGMTNSLLDNIRRRIGLQGDR